MHIPKICIVTAFLNMHICVIYIVSSFQKIHIFAYPNTGRPGLARVGSKVKGKNEVPYLYPALYEMLYICYLYPLG
jgi:hypothetical protein